MCLLLNPWVSDRDPKVALMCLTTATYNIPIAIFDDEMIFRHTSAHRARNLSENKNMPYLYLPIVRGLTAVETFAKTCDIHFLQ